MTTDRLQAGKNGESECIILYTLTRVEADITSSLGMKTTDNYRALPSKVPTYTGTGLGADEEQIWMSYQYRRQLYLMFVDKTRGSYVPHIRKLQMRRYEDSHSKL